MRKRFWVGVCVTGLLGSPGGLTAQGTNLEDLPLEALLNMKVTVAGASPSTLRESPGIVSVVTKEEIQRSGARNLMDVLRLVPGFDFGVDVQGVVGIGVRGNWAHEGKVSLRIDGIEMNELLYTTLQFGQHYPVENIKQVEIIRGPGSAIYGGFAELAVINVLTERAQDNAGSSVMATAGRMEHGRGHEALSARAAYAIDPNSSFDLFAQAGRGIRSDRTYVAHDGTEASMEEARLQPSHINGGFQIGGFRLRGLVDQYRTRQVDELPPEVIPVDFASYALDGAWDLPLGEQWKITPFAAFKSQKPWKEPPTAIDVDPPLGEPDNLFYDVSVERRTGGVRVGGNPAPALNLSGGYEYTLDAAKDLSETGDNFNTDPTDRVHYSNRVLYAEALARTPLADITLGGRWDDHTKFGSSFTPRVGLTRVLGRAHFKALYSEAFRAPGIENINTNADIQPEETRVWELETGLQAGRSLFLSANVFDITIDKPIVYFNDGNTENYLNFGPVATRGLEMEARLRQAWGYANLSYSFYTVRKNEVPAYAVDGDKNALVGFAPHKVTLNASLNLWRGGSLNPTGVYTTGKYAYVHNPDTNAKVLRKEDPTWLVSLYLLQQQWGVDGLEAGVGVQNLLNDKVDFPQPYDNDLAPLPDGSREFFVKVSYRFATPDR